MFVTMKETCDQSKAPGHEKLLSGVSAMALIACLMTSPALAQSESEAEEETTQAQDVVVVTGFRASLRTSQDIKRDSEVFVDSITAEDIGALPDRSVTEALQRIPGISIDRFQAGVDPDHFSIEGSGVVVRGLTWVRSELNGRDTFSANNGRILSFADVPAELLGGVDVFKNQSADMIEGGISGSINLRTRVPFDSAGRMAAASIEGSYGDFAKEWSPTVSALFSDRWETARSGEFGFLINYVNSQLTARSDGQQISNFGQRTLFSNGDVVDDGASTPVGTVWFPRGAAFRSQTFEREREGIGAAAQWRSPDRTLEATAQFLRSDSQQAWTEHAIEIATDNVADNGDSRAFPGTTLSFGSDGVFTSGLITSDSTGWRDDQFGAQRTPVWGLQSNNIRRDQEQRYVTTDYGFNLRWTPEGPWSFNFDYQHVTSTVDVTDLTLWNSTYQDAEIELRGSSIPIVRFRNPGSFWGPDADPNDPAQGVPGTPCTPPAQHCPNYAGQSDLSSPAATFTRAAMDHIEQSEGKLDAFRFDADYSFSNMGWLESVRFGARRSIRNQTTRFSTYNWGVISEQWGSGGPVWLDGNVPGLGDLAGYHAPFGFDNFMRGKVPVPTGDQPRLFWGSNIIQDYQGMIDYARGVNDSWRPDTACGQPDNWQPLHLRCGVDADSPFLLQEINPSREQTDALYAMVRYNTDLDGGAQLSGNFGVRYVSFDREASGWRAFNQQGFLSDAECDAQAADPDQTTSTFCQLDPQVRADARAFANGALEPNDAVYTDDFWLPSFNAVLRLENGWQFRLGLSQALTWPDIGLTRNYYDISLSTTSEDIVDGRPTGRFSVGNPMLRPIRSDNFDLSAEWYFAEVGSLTLSLFYKRLHDVHTNGTERIAFTNNGATFDAVVTTPVNADTTGTLKGFEIAYQQVYDMLPAPFDGLGIQANYTYVDSSGVSQSTLSATDPDVSAGLVANVDTSRLPLQGLSKHTANFATFYESDRWSARLAYSWRSDFVVTVRDVIVPFAPIIQEDSGQLDGSLFYTVNDNVRIGVQAVNLTNEVTRTSQVLNDDLLTAPRSWFMNDRRFTFLVRASF
ncbi:TonB-dependent receptor [Alkalicaulis satelles]|uniref:TonB-dependent receptor n=1 Tax=Alkalicaulis satelles TaxID=2609175 RepID=A0A5M6ZJP1_9PROT|nr:TonB-dependent receptor [Alkalicaulis satelles]KAA5805042.1 TonB-dependent receptor [Alkalicaulis satelles]